MALIINTNVPSLTSQRALHESGSELSTAMERLSTGLKINAASDDAAGLAMTQRMTAQVRGLSMAVKNANDGMAMTKSVEGAIGEVSDMLQRMRELAIQAANGTNSSADRTFLQNEVNLLIQEITRVSTNTRYNGELILDGTFINKNLQVGIEEGEVITMSVESIAAEKIGAHTLVGNGQTAVAAAAAPGANPTLPGDTIEIFGFLGTKLITPGTADSAKSVARLINNQTGVTGVKAYAKNYAALHSNATADKTYSVKINGYSTGNFVISKGSVQNAVDAINQISGATGVTAHSQATATATHVVLFDSDGDDITIENTQTLAGHTDLRVQKIDETGVVAGLMGTPISLALAGGNDATRVTGTLKMTSANAFSVNGGSTTGYTGAAAGAFTAELKNLTEVNISTMLQAGDSISIIDSSLNKIAQMRANLGAIENRLDYTITNLMNIGERTADSRSRLQDADYALESSRLAKAQVIQQAGTQMLSQANQMTQLVLDLLR